MSDRELAVLQDRSTAPSAGPAASSANNGSATTPRIPEELSILPVRGLVVFPGAVLPLTVSRPASIKLLDDTLPLTKVIGLVTQRDEAMDEPRPQDLHHVGTAVIVLKLLRQADDRVVMVVQGLRRFAMRKIVATEPYIRAEVDLPESISPAPSSEWQAEFHNLRDSAVRLLELTPDTPEQAEGIVRSVEDPGQLADFLAPSLDITTAQKQGILEEFDVQKRVRAVQTSISAQLEIAQIQQRLQEDVQSQFTEAQRKAYLRGQLKAIQRELGEGDDAGADEQIATLRTRLEEAQPPAEVMAAAERELKRLNIIPAASPEYSVIVSYVETIAELPWSKMSDDNLDLNKAQEILDRDHYDLEKVKRRLIEYLAVRKLNPKGQGPILCLIGPPGVGKTSLGQSIADALGRKFVRMSLGGIRDEAEIRGHRRTYIGAMPGRLIQELRRAGTRNPVMMLDEIDKIGADFRGDPASALLEVLDPRQNFAFVDRYLDVPFDLSQIIFIATANYIGGIPAPLLDRMEMISLAGYTEREKLEIAKRYIVARQLTENGLGPEQIEWNDDALRLVITAYTHEAGVRDLERQVGAISRSIAAKVARGEVTHYIVTIDVVHDLLGAERFTHEERLTSNLPGIVTGLAYTPTGGEILHIEATKYPGKGGVTLTGQIGDVMKESVQAALSVVRSRDGALGIKPEDFRDSDIHVHVPAGAIPKDGPSAGVAMFAALASLFSNRAVRADVAMTGEVTLRGLVLPIGGLKEKSLAAMRAGITTVLIPKGNEKDLVDVPGEAKEKINFIPVSTVDEVLANALEARPTTNSGGAS